MQPKINAGVTAIIQDGEIRQSLYLTMDASENSIPSSDLMSFKNDKTVKI